MGILNKLFGNMALQVAGGYLVGKFLVKGANKFLPTDWQL
jgi:hypothetical protein